uniref:Histone acetyltransferase n=1 Tax=Heterorhabditis bacteriophora TaxID=37862 RepID=A0A1I7WJC8_HETBA
MISELTSVPNVCYLPNCILQYTIYYHLPDTRKKSVHGTTDNDIYKWFVHAFDEEWAALLEISSSFKFLSIIIRNILFFTFYFVIIITNCITKKLNLTNILLFKYCFGKKSENQFRNIERTNK